MDPSPRSWELADSPEVDELQLLGAFTSVPTLCVPSGGSLDLELARERLGPSTWALVRPPMTATSGACCLTLLEPAATPTAELEAAVSCAGALLGLSAARFTGDLPAAVRAGAASGADEALCRLTRAAGLELGPPSFERLAVVCAHLAARAPSAPLLIQGLIAPRRFASLATRDQRTGLGPCRLALSTNPCAALDGRLPQRLPAELEGLATEARGRLVELATRLELELGRPARAAIELDDAGPRLVAVHALRRSGLVAFGLVHDLIRGGLPVERALKLIGHEDVLAAVQLRIDASPDDPPVIGTAAGTGIAEGRVCLTPRAALELSSAGLPPILFVHDIEPEDLDAMRASAGVVAVHGGLTGEAAVVARGLGKPCVASGAALSVGPHEVRFSDRGTLREGQRVTIDGSTGAIARGAHPRSMPAPSAAVAFVLSLLSEASSDVVAAVDHPAHVTTATRLGARRLVVARPEAVLLDAAEGGPEAVAAALRAIFEAASGQVDRVYVVPPAPGVALPAPFARRVEDADARAFVDAALQAGEAAGVRVVLGEEATAAAGASCRPEAVLAARIRAAQPARPSS